MKKSPFLNYEQLLSSVFQFFMSNFFFQFSLHSSVRTKKLLNIKVKKNFKKIWEVFFLGGVEFFFFRAICFGYHSKGCLSATPSFSLLVARS